jgi:hypothetical protein
MQTHNKTNRLLPAAQAENAQVQDRGGRYGEKMVIPVGDALIAFLEEGSLYSATNPTMGTGIAMGIQTTFSDTANVLCMLRNNDGAGAKKVWPLYLRLICTAAGLTTTSSRMAIVIDDTNRYSSGGTPVLTPNNRNMAIANTSIAIAHFGIITAAAVGGNVRRISNLQLKTQAAPCWMVGDEVIICFGSLAAAMGLLNGAAANAIQKMVALVCIGPLLHSLLFHMWNPANATTAPSWETELCWIER